MLEHLRRSPTINTMPSIEAVLFDYGMVLSAPPLASAWERMKSITGLDEARLHAGYWQPRHDYDRGTQTGEQFWRIVGTHSGVLLTEEQIADLLAADIDLWGELNQPMVEWVWQLQQAGVRTGILSNMGDAMAAGLLAKYDWLANFHHRTWSYALKIAKPELDIYHHAARGLGTEPNRILFIDDKEENLAAAREAGMQTVCYTSHAAFVEEMEARGFRRLLHPAADPLRENAR